MGKPRKFKTEEELFNTFLEYVEFCRSIDFLPNIAGFCRYCDMTREVFYDCKEFYPYTVKKIEEILEDEALNTKSVNDTMKIFYMKNKFSKDYKDRHEFDVTQREYDIEG